MRNHLHAHCVRRQHSRVHTGEKPFKCPHCSKSCATSSNLKSHVRLHMSSPFVCLICKKSFHGSSALRKHLKIHSGIKSYSCSQCSKCFINLDGLQRYLRIHSGEKPYSCLLCQEALKCSYRGIALQMYTVPEDI